ncbi:PBECR2 nuclease fold domain-containing protein [Campylobacter concisus]|uniref:PBECR2 nuclease fold domain-containing protein n=1 Tax=Campylobacter concisus TaxID=199 RepID=UPI00112FADF4|nr:PBECR2 nuclease fold domain-containing protein [Campylobacter concisus]
MDEAKFELSKELQGKTDLGEKISTSLAWLHSKHPEMFENKRAVKELIDYVLDEPNTIKAGKSENSVYLGKKDGTKIKDIVVNKSENKIIHANRRRMSTDEIKADGKDAHIPLHTDTMPAGATGANARSSADESIISQKDKEEQKVVQQASIKTNNNESIKTIVENLSRNREIALKLNPKADLLMAVKDFSKPIETPIFKAKVSIDKMLNHIIEKPNGDKRLSYLNLVKPTLENPLFVTKEENRYRFVKTFIDDKEKVLKFLSVIENNKGEVLGITATPIKNTDIKNLIKGDIVWGGDTLSSLSTPQAVKRELDTDKSIIAQNSKDSVEKLLTAIDTSGDKVGLVKKVLLNKDISDGVKAKAVNRLTKNKISQGAKTSYISTKNSKNN